MCVSNVKSISGGSTKILEEEFLKKLKVEEERERDSTRRIREKVIKFKLCSLSYLVTDLRIGDLHLLVSGRDTLSTDFIFHRVGGEGGGRAFLSVEGWFVKISEKGK